MRPVVDSRHQAAVTHGNAQAQPQMKRTISLAGDGPAADSQRRVHAAAVLLPVPPLMVPQASKISETQVPVAAVVPQASADYDPKKQLKKLEALLQELRGSGAVQPRTVLNPIQVTSPSDSLLLESMHTLKEMAKGHPARMREIMGEDISLHRLFSHVAQVFPAALPEVVDALLEMYSEVWEAETAAVDQLDALRMLRDEVQDLQDELAHRLAPGSEGSSSSDADSDDCSGSEAASDEEDDVGQDGGEHFISEAGTGIAHAGESAIFAAFTGSSLPALAGSARVARKAGRH